MYKRISFYLLLLALVIVFLFAGRYGVAHSSEIIFDFLTYVYIFLFLSATIVGMLLGSKGGSRFLVILHVLFLFIPLALFLLDFIVSLLE